jgi:hypothetical protein
MDKDFIQYVCARIEKALTESAEYVKLQSKCAEAGHDIMLQNKEYEYLTALMDTKTQELCYIKGYQDGLALMMNIKKTE